MYFRNPLRSLILYIAAAVISFACCMFMSWNLLVSCAGHPPFVSIGEYHLGRNVVVIWFLGALVSFVLLVLFVYLAKKAWPRLVELRLEKARNEALREMASIGFKRSMELALEEFAFLAEQGFVLSEKKGPTGTSYRDGWILTYSSELLEVDVRYLGAEFEVEFRNQDTKATYLLLDRFLFEGASGYGGCMFSGDKLENAIKNIADDIKKNYSKVLKGDNDIWGSIREHTKSLDIWEKLYTDKRGSSFNES